MRHEGPGGKGGGRLKHGDSRSKNEQIREALWLWLMKAEYCHES